MFGNQDEINQQIPNYMVINIIGSNYLHEGIISMCLDIIEGDYVGRFRVVSLLNPDQLIYKKLGQSKDNLGLLNLDWMKKTIVHRPATVVLVYDMRNKTDSVSWKDYENSIYLDITKVKKMDNYQFLNIIVILYVTLSSFSFDNVNEDRERSYNIRKIIDPKNIFLVGGSDGLKNISKKLSAYLIKMTVNYYRTLKKNIKIKKNNSNEIKEKMIKYQIKLGVISQIKNKRPSWKYFEEAYSLISGLDFKNYYYGSQNVKLNYFEIKGVADWLFFKIFYLKIFELSTNIQSIISNFNFHVNHFSKPELFTNEEPCDKMLLTEFYWRLVRYEFIAKFLEENEKYDFYVKSANNFPGYHYLLSSFNVVRMIKFINQVGFDNLLLLNDKNTKTDSLRYRESKFFGKPPRFYELIDPLTERDYLFDENIYMRNFINNFNITYDHLYSKLNENLSKAQKLYSSNFLKSKENSMGSSSMTIFFNILSVLHNENYSKNYDKLKYLYRTFVACPDLNKFPKLHVKYLEEYNHILLNDDAPDKFPYIMNNLIAIASMRNFTKEEEELFFKIIYSEHSYEIKQKLVLGKTSKIISFDYSVSNNTPKIFEIIEYKLNFKSELFIDTLKIKSINLFFNNQERNKAFFETQYELSKASELNLSYKILIKDTDKQLKLKSIRFELLTHEDQSLYFEINLKTDKDKVITMKNLASNVLDFNYPKNISIGINQYYKYECVISKTDDSLEVENIVLKFTVNDENEDIGITKSVVINPKHKGAARSTSNINYSSNISIEEFNVRQTQDEDLFEKLPNDLTLTLFDHEIITKNIDSSLTNHRNIVILKVNKVDSDSPVKCNFLIKFNDPGKFSVKLDADYKIMRKEIYDDTSNLKHTGMIKIEVKVPLNVKYDFYCGMYMSLQQHKIYCVEKTIKLNTTLTSNLEFGSEIKNIQIYPISEDLEIDCPLRNVLTMDNNLSFILQNNTEFLIPFNFKFRNQFSGSLGKFKIFWRDSNLKSFDESILNETELIFPDVNVKKYDLSLDYEVPRTISQKGEVEMKIIIKNLSEEFKRLVFLFDTSANYVTSGQVKKKFLIYPNENKEIKLPLIPVNFGRLKLPLFKIMEFPLASSTYENKIYSIYMIPDYIQVNGN